VAGYFEHTEMEMIGPGRLDADAGAGGRNRRRRARLEARTATGHDTVRQQADMLVLNANPLSDIRNTRQIHSVWIGGRQLAQTNMK